MEACEAGMDGGAEYRIILLLLGSESFFLRHLHAVSSTEYGALEQGGPGCPTGVKGAFPYYYYPGESIPR